MAYKIFAEVTASFIHEDKNILNRIAAAFVLSGLLISGPSLADSDQELTTASNGEAVSEVIERDVPALRKKVFKQLWKAQDDLEEKKLDKAEKRLNKLLARDDLNKYELASVYNSLAYIYYATKDYPAAIKWYERVVEQSPSIPLKLESGTLYTLGLLYLLSDNPVASRRAFEQYLELTDDPNPNIHGLLAEVYWLTDQLEKGRPYLERHLQLLEEREKEPSERFLEIVAAYEIVASP